MTELSHQEEARPSSHQVITLRAVLVALFALVLLAPAAFISDIRWGKGTWGVGSMAPFPISLIFVLAFLTGISRTKWFRFSRQELLVVYAIVLVGAPMLSRYVLFYVLPKGILYYYMARQNPLWEKTFLKYIPTWFAPSEMGVVEGFFLGQSSVPWASWLVPLATWGSVMLALFCALFCANLLLHRQWISHERLAFPLAQIPLELTHQEATNKRHGAFPILSIPAFKIGLLISLGICFLHRLAAAFPALPSIPTGPLLLLKWTGIGPVAGLGALYLNFSPSLLGIVYLIPTELSFSCWFFWALRLIVHVIAIACGVTPQKPESWGNDFPAPYETGAGATIALGLWSLWIARRHFLRLARTIFTFQRKGQREDDPVLYRIALAGFLLSFGWLLMFCWLAGCRLIFAVVYMTIIVGSFLVWTRIRADTALEPCVSESYGWLLAPISSGSLRPQEIITLISMRWATFPVGSMIFSVHGMNAMDALKIGDAGGLRIRKLAGYILVGFIISLIVGCVVMLVGMYHYGYFGTQAGAAPDWPSLYSRRDGDIIADLIINPSVPDRKALYAMGAGGGICLLLGILRLSFAWWPFHPVGFIVAMGWGLIDAVFPFFIAWAVKSLVIRYGGLKLYRLTVPIAISLIVGEMLNTTLWSLASLFSSLVPAPAGMGY